MYSHLGQEQDPAEAAGQAARERAEQSSWPPTESDFEAVGAAAGTAAGAAAGAAVGGPLGAIIGSAIGGIVGGTVGGAVFSLGDAIAGGLDPNRGASIGIEYARWIREQVANSPRVVAEELAAKYGTSVETELDALERWGAPIDDRGYPEGWESWIRQVSNDNFAQKRVAAIAWQKKLFAATAARVAELEAAQAPVPPPPRSSSAAPLVVGAAIVAGAAWLLLA
jgi:hypothetical protein